MIGGRPEEPRSGNEHHQDSQQSRWIPILDYAVMRGVSTSTLRRYIKAKKIEYKIENGRYLLLANVDARVPKLNPRAWDGVGVRPEVSAYNRVQELEEKLMQAEEQISELKMLVAIYEEKLAQLDR